jgi:two-component system cell cycle response regulator
MNNVRNQSRILIVDDEPLNVKLLAAMLPADQYETIKAYDGREALKKIVNETPDLILLDVMMPGLDGYEVTRTVKNDSDTRDIPVILVTALDGTDNKIKGLEAGADEFLNKPVSKTELIARVNSLLRLKQYQDQLKTHMQSKNHFTTPDQSQRSIEEEINLPSILIVEDDVKDAKLILNYLHGEAYIIKQVKDGEEAISRARQEKIDLILLDILLPGMDGFETCRRLKAMDQTKDIQIVALTSLNDMESKVKGIELGADDYLVKPINMHELRVRIKALVKKKAYLDRLHANYEMAVHSAITDKLTGLYNHAYFEHFLGLEVKRSLRQNMPVSLMMIDIDDFKQYNDTLGHLAGDQILSELGQLIKTNIREIDLAARYGGEEFSVVLPGVDLKGAVTTAERVRQVIHENSFSPELSSDSKNLSVSIGIAACPSDAEAVKELINKADMALYKAKREGKNRVCL